MQRFEILTQILSLAKGERSAEEVRAITQILMDFKWFVDLTSQRHADEPSLVTDLAKSIELLQFKPGEVIGSQEELQERPLFLMLGEVLMSRQVKDVQEAHHLNKMAADHTSSHTSRHSLNGPKTYSPGTIRPVGTVKPGKWLYHLSYLLKMPLHATFSAGPMERVYCLTLSPEAHAKLIGAYERREIQEAMRFLIACNLGEHLTQTTLILMASKLRR
jgi:hypothetical protein